MATPAEELSQNIRDQFLSCKICLDGLKEPKSLPCLHTFCAECILYYVEHNRLDHRKFACPICRKHIYIPKNGIDGFPDSFFVSSLKDIVAQQRGEDKKCHICRFKEVIVDSDYMCVECKIELCTDCRNTHSEEKVTETHTLLPFNTTTAITRENYCRAHRGETIKYYCNTCNSPICLPCTFLDHKGHEIEEIKNVRNAFNEEMTTMVLQSNDNIMQLEAAKEDLEELERELFIRKETVRAEISVSVQELIKEARTQEKDLIQELETFYDIPSLRKDIQKVDQTTFKLKQAHSFAEQLLAQSTSPITQLVNRTEAKENLAEAIRYDLPDVTRHHQKLNQYAQFLLGQSQLNLGSLLKCNEQTKFNMVTQYRPTVPSTKAMYSHKLRPNEEGGFSEVLGMKFLVSSELVVLFNTGKKIKIFNRLGRLKFEFGTDDEIRSPSDIAITRDGDIAVTDLEANGVKVFDQFGGSRFEFGGQEMFQTPIALAVDQMGKFVVLDQTKHVISVHRDMGELIIQYPINEIPLPQDICVTGTRIYVSDCENKIVGLYHYTDQLQFKAKLGTVTETPASSQNQPSTENMEVETAPGSSTSPAAQSEAATAQSGAEETFLDCSGMCIGRGDDLLITDSVQNRLHVFNSRNEISTIIACGRPFLRPVTVAASKDGLLAVSQQGVEVLQTGQSKDEICIYRLLKSDV